MNFFIEIDICANNQKILASSETPSSTPSATSYDTSALPSSSPTASTGTTTAPWTTSAPTSKTPKASTTETTSNIENLASKSYCVLWGKSLKKMSFFVQRVFLAFANGKRDLPWRVTVHKI